MKEKNLGALHSNMEILISGLDVFAPFKCKDNLTDSTVWHIGETGDICFTFKKLLSPIIRQM